MTIATHARSLLPIAVQGLALHSALLCAGCDDGGARDGAGGADSDSAAGASVGADASSESTGAAAVDAASAAGDAGDPTSPDGGVDRAALDAGTPSPLRVLIFSRTQGYRHASIEPGIAALRALGEARNWRVEATEDAAEFRDARLADFDVVVWLSTTGDVLDAAQQEAFERYVRGGGGYAGIHAATDTEYDWPFYGELLGTWFSGHPAIQTASIVVEDAEHPATAALPARFEREDEWYNFADNPRAGSRVLLTLDETSYEGGTMGADHPIAWTREIDAGRMFYSGGGHTEASFAEPRFLEHLAGGIEWAGGRGAGR